MSVTEESLKVQPNYSHADIQNKSSFNTACIYTDKVNILLPIQNCTKVSSFHLNVSQCYKYNCGDLPVGEKKKKKKTILNWFS